MTSLNALINRNIRLFFKDRGMLISALVTPLILLFLYITFLASTYKSIFVSNMPEGFSLPESLIDACVGGQLVSSLLAVCCVTVAFCANLIMVQDKATGARGDLNVSPVKSSTLAVSYYIATLVNTLVICLIAAGACFLYMSGTGWYLSNTDVMCLLFDILLLTMFGTALSTLVCTPLSTEGQMSAVSTIMSAGYGFVCGAYMPISQFGSGLQTALSFLPGTYGTSLMRNHAMRGVFAEMQRLGVPVEVTKGIGDSIDCNLSFLGTPVSLGAMYMILGVSVAVLVAAFILLTVIKGRKHRA